MSSTQTEDEEKTKKERLAAAAREAAGKKVKKAKKPAASGAAAAAGDDADDHEGAGGNTTTGGEGTEEKKEKPTKKPVTRKPRKKPDEKVVEIDPTLDGLTDPSDTDENRALLEQLLAMENGAGRSTKGLPSPRDWLMTISELDLLTHLQAHAASEVDTVFDSQASARAYLARERTRLAEELYEQELATVGDGDYLARETHKKTLTDAATKAFDELGRVMFRFNGGSVEVVQKDVLEALAPMRKLIHFGLIDLNRPLNRWHRSALAVAIEFGADKLVAWLLQHGADPDAKTSLADGKGTRPLHIALSKLQERGFDAHSPFYTIIWMLLERGADIEGLDDDSRSALDIANAIILPAPFPLALVYNMIRLVHDRLPKDDHISKRQPYHSLEYRDSNPSYFVPPLASTIAEKVKAIAEREAAEKAEQERLRKQREAEEEKAQSQANTRKVVDALKRAKGVREQLDTNFADLNKTWLEALRILCDPENFVLFEPRVARPGAEKKPTCSLDSKLKLPQQTYLRSAIVFGNPYLVEALAVAYSNIMVPLSEPLEGASLAPEIDLKTDLGETPLHLAAKRVTPQDLNTQSMIITLLTYGADLNAKDANGNTPLDVCTSEEMKQWISSQDASADKYERTAIMRQARLPMILELAEAAERELQAKLKLEQEIAEQRRAAEEEIQKREAELEQQRLEREKEEKLRQEREERELQQRRKEEEEELKRNVEALRQAELARIAAATALAESEASLPQSGFTGQRTTTIADRIEAKADDEAKLREEAENRLKQQGERLSRAEQKRRDEIEATEKAEEGKIPNLAERQYLDNATGKLLFADTTEALPIIKLLEPRVSDFTKHCMNKMHYDYKFYRNKLNGFAITFKEYLEDIETDTEMSVWDKCKFIIQEISAHEGYIEMQSKILQAAETAWVIREIKRRQAITVVKIRLLDDLLRPLLESLGESTGDKLIDNDLRNTRRYMAKRQEAQAKEEGEFYEPIINPVLKTEAAATLAELAESNNPDISAALQELTEEQREMTVAIDNLPTQLRRPELTEWGALALVKDRLNATVSELQDATAAAAATSSASQDTSGEEGETKTTSEELDSPPTSPLIKALELQKKQCEDVIEKLQALQQDRYNEISPYAQKWWQKKAEAEEARARAAQIALEDAKKQREIARLGKFESLINSISKEHEDWDRRRKQPQVTIAKVDEEEVPDLGPDLGWMRDNIDFTGIDEDIKKYCRQNPKHMVRLYLASKGAENEADEVFVRKVLQKSADSLTPTQRNDLVDYLAFLQRRTPQFRRLFIPYTKDIPAHRVQELNELKEATKNLVVERRFHDAKVQVTDWRDFKTQIAVETFLDVVCAGSLDMHVGPRDAVPLTVLIELHRSLHCECCVSEDLVEMVVGEIAKDGIVTRSNFLACLEALQVACRRDEQVRWDSQTIWPTHPRAYGSMNPSEAELVFSFNDQDVVRKFFNDFVQGQHDEVFKSTLAKSKHFAPDVYSRVCRNLGKASYEFLEYLVQSGRTKEAIELSGQEIARLANAESGATPEKDDASSPYVPSIPVLHDSFVRRDPFVGLEDLDPKRILSLFSDVDEYNEVSARPEYGARLPIGFNDLRRALVQVPKLEFYSPRGWKADDDSGRI